MFQSRRHPGNTLWFCLLLLLFPGHAPLAHAADPERVVTIERNQLRIQEIVNEFKARLPLPQRVAVAIVPKNPLMLSVEFDDVDSGFLISVEEGFVGELTDDELQAAVAHELGHVWIFTHHPFLQTEALANQIAERLVTRDSLVHVYEKVWKRQGTKGDLARFVGD